MKQFLQEITIGGLSGLELLERLQGSGIQINEIARQILMSENFKIHPRTTQIKVAFKTLRELGLRQGGVLTEAIDAAEALGYGLCPLALGPHLRLAYLDQEEGAVGFEPSRHQAPPRSITVVHQRPENDGSEYLGFYLLRMDGLLWLRGYKSWSGHTWQPNDRLAFAITHDAA